MHDVLEFKKTATGHKLPVMDLEGNIRFQASWIRYNYSEDGEAEIIMSKELEESIPVNIATLDSFIDLTANMKPTLAAESLEKRQLNNWNLWVYVKGDVEEHYFLQIAVV